MPLKVTDAAIGARRFVNRGQAAAGDYKDGVAGSGQTWESNTAASEENYNAGVQAAIGRNAFGKGVRKAGGAKFQDKAATVGAQRYPQGVANGGPAWQQGSAPYLNALASLTLPPRRPKGDPGNIQRVSDVATALRRIKTGQ